MVTVGQAAVCFSCGQPIPRDLAPETSSALVDAGARALFPLTGAMQSPLAPPPNPYGGGAVPVAASLVGVAGHFAIRAGLDVKVGRDPAQCPITLEEPRVSGVHATLRFVDGRLEVRDETSNNGTYVNGARIPAGSWTALPNGTTVRFGPVELTVRIE